MGPGGNLKPEPPEEVVQPNVVGGAHPDNTNDVYHEVSPFMSCFSASYVRCEMSICSWEQQCQNYPLFLSLKELCIRDSLVFSRGKEQYSIVTLYLFRASLKLTSYFFLSINERGRLWFFISR